VEPMKVSVREMYTGNQDSYDAFLAILDQTQNPRSPDMMYDKFGELGPTLESMVLDIGCRHAVQACEISQRFGCRVMGIDLVDDNIQEARKNIAEKKLEQLVEVFHGDIHHLPFKDGMFDFIWCRDVLGHMDDLHQSFRSCARVLKPHGKLLVFHVFATQLLTPEEATQLFLPLATVPENMSQSYFEKAFASAGFSVIEADALSSEWREYSEETDYRVTSKQLLHIARMRRHRERYIAEFGEKDYTCELANCHWGVYQMLGKLSPIIYTLVNSSDK
jgi:ubiquinone/menaquinone biosynthesis C-methylase UbiE